MRKFTFLKMLFMAIALVMGSVNVWAQGSESFTNCNATNSYANGSYIGDNNITWSYVASRNVDVYGITGAGIMLRRVADNSKISSSTISGGINSFTCSLKKAFTGAGNRQVELFINGISIATSIAWDNTNIQTFTVSNINISGNIIIEIRNITAFQVTIDAISWTGLASSCTPSTLAFATPIVDKTMANVSYTQTATSLNATTPITYSSSNTAVAFTVGGSALATIAGAGSTVITATQAAGTHNGVDYCASTASYTLNVASIAPTITVTEVTVPNMTSYVGNTKTETVNVSGINLTENLTVSIIDDVDNQFDEPSITSIAKLGDNTASGTVTVTYRPTAAGTHTATLKIESLGATSATRALSGTATWTPLTTPVATTANPISNSGFTANWDAVVGSTEYQLDVYTKAGGNVPDLIISEYCEGSSNNKYIEIFNGTGNNVDLSQYSVELYANGATTAGNTITLSGTLMNGDVYTIYNSGSVVAISSIGDIASTVTFFNGDDAFVLKKNGVIIDSFGQLGTDPGTAWDVNGVTTLDKTLVRKSTVTSGRTSASSTFDPSAEWDQYSIDTFDYLGAHTMTGAVTLSPISGSPFTVTGETSKAISGLGAETTYYYTVIAKNTNVASALSNEITVTTSPTTSIDQLSDKLNLHVSDNRIEFISSANETVAIYNAVGQKLVQKLTVNGLNSIPVSAHGVVLVKVGNRFAKVIL